MRLARAYSRITDAGVRLSLLRLAEHISPTRERSATPDAAE
jgi:hypothetical protein